MKITLFISLFIFFFLEYSEKRIDIGEEPKSINLCFALNQKDKDVFGLPIKSSKKEFHVSLKYKDSIRTTLEYGIIHFFPWTSDTLFFEYRQKQMDIVGSFIIPKFKEIRYSYGIDPETYRIGEISPFYCYCPIRQGSWIIKSNGTTKAINFNVRIKDMDLDK